MAKGNQKTVVLIGSLVVIGSIGAYLWIKHKKAQATEGGSSETPSGTPETPKEPNAPARRAPVVNAPQLTGKANIQAFQDWMDATHPNWVNGKNLNRRNGYGSIGPATSKAWKTYAAEYRAPAPMTPVIPKSQFRAGQDVVAKVKFRASAVIKRNGRWFTTNEAGNPLPSREFNQTALVGQVQFEYPNDPAKLIVMVKDGIQGYPYALVKASWIE